MTCFSVLSLFLPLWPNSKRISEPTDYPVVPRSCGGSRTNTWTGQRRSGPQHTKLLPQAEADGVSQVRKLKPFPPVRFTAEV